MFLSSLLRNYIIYVNWLRRYLRGPSESWKFSIFETDELRRARPIVFDNRPVEDDFEFRLVTEILFLSSGSSADIRGPLNDGDSSNLSSASFWISDIVEDLCGGVIDEGTWFAWRLTLRLFHVLEWSFSANND